MSPPTLSSLPTEVLCLITSYLPLPAIRALLISHPASFRRLHWLTTRSEYFAPWRRRYFKYQRIYEHALRAAQDKVASAHNDGVAPIIPSGQVLVMTPIELELEKASQDMLRDFGLLPAMVSEVQNDEVVSVPVSQANGGHDGGSASTDTIYLPCININMLFLALEHLSGSGQGHLKLSSLKSPLSAITTVMSRNYPQLELIQKLVPITLLPRSSSPLGSMAETAAAYKIFTAYLLYTSLVPNEILGILSDALSVSGKDPHLVDAVRAEQEMALVEYFYFLRLFLLLFECDDSPRTGRIWINRNSFSRQARRILAGRLDAWVRAYFRPERPLPPVAAPAVALIRSSTQPSLGWGKTALMGTSPAPRHGSMARKASSWSAPASSYPSSSPIAKQPSKKFVLTQEQQKIVDVNVSAGELMKVRAFAGTGKTMSLTEYASQRLHKRPRIKFLYVAFNRSARMDAERKFGSNVTCKTIHSIALGALQRCAPQIWNALPDPRRDFTERRRDGRMPTMEISHNFGAREVIEILGLNQAKITSALISPQEHTQPGIRRRHDGKKLFPTENAVATVVKKALERYWSSKDVKLGEKCLPWSMAKKLGLRGDIILKWSEKLWEGILNATVKYLPHDAYMKILHLDGIQEEEGTGVGGSMVSAAGEGVITDRPLVRGEGDTVAFGAYDVIMFDEAQDSNPSIAEIILRQRPWVGLIVVGDPYQKIYGFRGATNECFDDETHPPTYSFYLTHSFRFGDAIAGVANVLLRALREPFGVHGVRKGDSVKRSLPQTLEMSLGAESREVQVLSPGAIEDGGSGKYTVIFRKNITLVEYAIAYCISHSKFGHRVSLRTAGNFTKASLFGLLKAAHSLYNGIPAKWGVLKGYKTWQELQEHVEAETADEGSGMTDSPGLSLVVDLGDMIASPDFSDTLKLCEEMVLDGRDEADADVVLITTHQAKGLEWDRVLVADDFNPPYLRRDSLANTKHWKEEMFMTYVAVTRAKKELIVGDRIATWLAAEMGMHRFYVSPTQGRDKCPVCPEKPPPNEDGGEDEDEDGPKRLGVVIGYDCVLATGSFGVKITEPMAKCRRPFGLKKDVVVCDICAQGWYRADIAGTDKELDLFSLRLLRAVEKDGNAVTQGTQDEAAVGPLTQRNPLSAVYPYLYQQETRMVHGWVRSRSELSVLAAREEEILAAVGDSFMNDIEDIGEYSDYSYGDYDDTFDHLS